MATNNKKGSNGNSRGRLANSTLCLSGEELKLVKMARAQFQRRGGWVRIFPTADTWIRYSQYLDHNTGIPVSSLPQNMASVPITHNYNLVLHNHLFTEIPKTPIATGNKTRHDRYERQLSQGHCSGKLEVAHNKYKNDSTEELKTQIVTMLKNGKVLTYV